jgi:O-antigen ligase
MNSLKPQQWAGIVLGIGLLLYFFYFHMQYFVNFSFLGGILLLEVIVAGLWRYQERFFALIMISFLWAGMSVPMQSAGTVGRWALLAAGAFVGCIIWLRDTPRPFQSIHLVALFSVFAAFVSASVSPFIQLASLKALSLFLLFLYCVSGARLAVVGREGRFFQGLLLGIEIAVYGTSLCWLVLAYPIWGNPNSLGAAMSIGAFPILLWGWFTSEGARKIRRLVALLLCAYLVYASMARAGMVTIAVVTLVFCFCLHQYKLLIKIAALVLVVVAISGVFAPETLRAQLGNLTDSVLYKGHKQEGVLGSRLTPWNKSIASIKEHPFFGTGYGTSPTGQNAGLGAGKYSSSAEEEREHGSSYITITEWVGLVGLLPFIALLALTASNVWRVCAWMKRTADPRHYSIPLAMVVLGGFAHAGFEDWLFAVGSYLCLWFWVCAFMLADLVPAAVVAPLPRAVSRVSRPSPASCGAVVSN